MPTETTPTLWCVHVLGPDELHATDSREAAFEQAEALNAAIAEHNAKQGWLDAPLCKATVAVWPWSAESHAADLAKQKEQRGDPAPEGFSDAL